jgi:2',3'-cyclic-nucleotide 2'-phosphodiesterase (5'-nucleotidase family)
MKKLTAVFFCVLMFGFSQLLAEKLTILHVGDTHSNLAPGGERDANLKAHNFGIARAVTYIKQIKSANPQTTLLLHSGDFSIGDMSFVKFFAVPELSILDSLRFDAVALGNHEFDLTPAVLSSTLNTVFKSGDSIPVLSANLNTEADGLEGLRKWIEPYVIKDYGFVKVGIFGMITPSTMLLSQPSPAVIEQIPRKSFSWPAKRHRPSSRQAAMSLLCFPILARPWICPLLLILRILI